MRAIRHVDNQEIIHIGDNNIADIEGARAIGIGNLLINSNGVSITKILNYGTRNLLIT